MHIALILRPDLKVSGPDISGVRLFCWRMS